MRPWILPFYFIFVFFPFSYFFYYRGHFSTFPLFSTPTSTSKTPASRVWSPSTLIPTSFPVSCKSTTLTWKVSGPLTCLNVTAWYPFVIGITSFAIQPSVCSSTAECNAVCVACKCCFASALKADCPFFLCYDESNTQNSYGRSWDDSICRGCLNFIHRVSCCIVHPATSISPSN